MSANIPLPNINSNQLLSKTTIKRPTEITLFSYDNDHAYHPDASSLKLYYPPTLPADLNPGFSSFTHFQEPVDPHLDSLLKRLIPLEKANSERTRADFITWRGMITKFMTAAYDRFAEFSMLCTNFEGTIFIQEDWDAKAAKIAAEQNRPPGRGWDPQRSKMMTYWGYKFETLSTGPVEGASREFLQKRGDEKVNNAAQFCSVVKTGFPMPSSAGRSGGVGQHPSFSAVLGGEVDCIASPRPPYMTPETTLPYMELKTINQDIYYNHNQHFKFEQKLLSFWAQSYLLGIPTIIIGLRDDNRGLITNIVDFKTHQIPSLVKQTNPRAWDANRCIWFTGEVLGALKDLVKEGEGVWRINLRKGEKVVRIWRDENIQGMGDIVSEEFVKWRAELGELQREKEKSEEN